MLPAAPFTPLEEFPPRAAASCHHDRCLLAVLPPSDLSSCARRFQSARFGRHPMKVVDFEALLHSRVRSVQTSLPMIGRPILPGLGSPSRSSMVPPSDRYPRESREVPSEDGFHTPFRAEQAPLSRSLWAESTHGRPKGGRQNLPSEPASSESLTRWPGWENPFPNRSRVRTVGPTEVGSARRESVRSWS